MKFRNVSIQGNRRTDRNYERENGESYTCLTAEGDNFVGGAVKRAEFCGIEIKQVPTKKIYPRGYDGNFNLTGMILTALYNDTSKNRNIDVQGALDDGTLRVLPVDFSVIGVRKITLEYQNGNESGSASFSIAVSVDTRDFDKLTGISVTAPIKTKYVVGDPFSTEGITPAIKRTWIALKRCLFPPAPIVKLT